MDNYNDQSSGAIFALFFGIYLLVILVIVVGTYVLYGIALSLFFKKVGVSPGIGWIPIYNYWKWLEVGGQQGWLSILAVVPYAGIVTSIFIYIGMWRTNIAFSKDTGIFVLGIFFPFVWLFIMASESSVYRPELIAQAGFRPPLAGYGSVPPYSSQTPPANPV